MFICTNRITARIDHHVCKMPSEPSNGSNPRLLDCHSAKNASHAAAPTKPQNMLVRCAFFCQQHRTIVRMCSFTYTIQWGCCAPKSINVLRATYRKTSEQRRKVIHTGIGYPPLSVKFSTVTCYARLTAKHPSNGARSSTPGLGTPSRSNSTL